MARIARPWFWKERGLWCVNRTGRRVPLGPHPEGSPPPKQTRGRWNTPEVILQAFHTVMAQASAPATPRPRRLALAALFEKYLAWCKLHRAPQTYAGYEWHITKFCEHLVARGMDPFTSAALDLRPFHVTEYLDGKPEWGQTCRRNAIASVKRAFKWGEEQGYIDSDPVRRLRKPTAARREDYITPEEWPAIRDSYAPEDPFRLFLEFIYDTGCRPQEARAIEPRHVHLDKAAILFPPKEEKTRKKWRIIRLEGRALEIVRDLMADPKRRRLFLNRDSKPWTSSALNCRCQRLADKLGKRYSPGLFRHSFCQRLLERGIDHMTVAALMGHANGTQVAATYQHMDKADAHLRAALRKGNATTAPKVTDAASPGNQPGGGADRSHPIARESD